MKKLNEELARAVRVPDIVKKLAEDGTEPVAGAPGELGRLIAVEVPRWRNVVKQAGIKVE